MISQKSYRNNQGIILIDAILALSLSMIFIVIITGSSLGSMQMFERAYARDGLMDAYESGSLASTSRTVWYGNDRVETDVSIFKAVRAYQYPDPRSAVGTPLCSVDFMHGQSSWNVSVITIKLPINQSIPLTDVVIRNGIVYVSADSAAASDPDLYVFNVSDPNNVRIISSINTGPGISAIALAGQRIYAAANSTAAQLHIIRFDSLTNPVLEKKYKLPLPYATATAPVADSVFYNDALIYLGTEKWDGDEFNVIDVSNPSAPNRLGGADTDGKVSALFVRNGIAYVASADQNQLRLLDVHDPANMWLMNIFSPFGWQRQEGQALDLFEDSLSFGRTSGGFDISADKEAFSWATTSLGSLMDSFSLNDPGGVYGIVADRSHLFLATRQTGKEFKIFDRSLSAISSTTYPLPASVQSMTCDNDSIYVLGRNLPLMYKISFN